MTLLIDTHLAIWWHFGDGRLSDAAREAVVSADGPTYFSQASLWEMAIKIAAGKSSIDLPQFAIEVERLGFFSLRMNDAHVFETTRLPWFVDHRDPFDRLLVAQARSEGFTLLTADHRLQRYGDFVRVV